LSHNGLIIIQQRKYFQTFGNEIYFILPHPGTQGEQSPS